jgi:hypothetical protein
LRIITGMHRSGTSLIAQLFYRAGADMGDSDTFYRPDRWNPDGYYEQPDIHAINMPLINGMWGKLAYFRLPSTKTILRRAEGMEQRIRNTASKYEGKVIKETRYCLTLPAWLKYGATVDRVLICLREPIQVARSIQRRNHSVLRHGYYMWVEHNTRILSHTEQNNIPVWIVDYNRVLDPDTYQQEMGAAFRFLGLDLSPDSLDDLRAQCVKPKLSHHSDASYAYPEDLARLLKSIKQQHAEQFNPH